MTENDEQLYTSNNIDKILESLANPKVGLGWAGF
jgi:hypothetical protein